MISQEKTEEELTLTITTNGAVAPKKALQETLELSKNSFNELTELINSEKKQKLTAETK